MKSRGWRIQDALNRAIQMEKQSYSLYVGAMKVASSPEGKLMLEELSKEERGHREKLENAKKGGRLSWLGAEKQVIDLGIVDHVDDVQLSQNPSYQEILIFAGKREKETHDYYMEMASRLKDRDVGSLFERLAKEELSHKAKIEREYERVILKEG